MEQMQGTDEMDKLAFNPLYNPQFKPQPHNPQNNQSNQLQYNSSEYQWNNYPANYNLTSFNPEQKQNHNEQQNNYHQQYASTPKCSKRVQFTPETTKTYASTPKFFKAYNEPYNQPYNQQYNNVNMKPKSNMCSPKFSFKSSQCGQQWTCNGISQERPYSEPILKHTQSFNSPKFNKYMPKSSEEIEHWTIAHMYTMSAHFENNILSVEVYDSIQGNQFRNEFAQNDFPMYQIYDIAKILVDAINSSKAGRNTISINGFKPISISQYGQWCYLTVNGTQIPSFALRPIY